MDFRISVTHTCSDTTSYSTTFHAIDNTRFQEVKVKFQSQDSHLTRSG